MIVYQVVKYEGFGTTDSPIVEYPLPDEVYTKKRNAEQRAYKLYEQLPTHYKGSWGGIHYGVKEVNIK